jgi:hypothetical protein
MDIKTSLDFRAAEHEILQSTISIKNAKNLMQALKLLKNIQTMNTKLSQLEVEDRRMNGRNRKNVADQVLLINNELDGLRQWITLLLLM